MDSFLSLAPYSYIIILWPLLNSLCIKWQLPSLPRENLVFTLQREHESRSPIMFRCFLSLDIVLTHLLGSPYTCAVFTQRWVKTLILNSKVLSMCLSTPWLLSSEILDVLSSLQFEPHLHCSKRLMRL